MPNLSTTPTQPSPGAAQEDVYIPFIAHIRVVPDLATGKRWSLIRNLEKIALRVENDLVGAGFNIATPVPYTVQFGDFAARLTIVGFVSKSVVTDGRRTSPPTTNIDLIHSGTDPNEKTGLIDGNRGGTLSEGQDPLPIIDTEVAELRAALDAASTLFDLDDIIHVEYNGVKYGLKKQGGRSFS